MVSSEQSLLGWKSWVHDKQSLPWVALVRAVSKACRIWKSWVSSEKSLLRWKSVVRGKKILMWLKSVVRDKKILFMFNYVVRAVSKARLGGIPWFAAGKSCWG
jgi:hypothetical protein